MLMRLIENELTISLTLLLHSSVKTRLYVPELFLLKYTTKSCGSTFTINSWSNTILL